MEAISLAIATLQSQSNERGLGKATIDDYDESQDPLDPVWTQPSINCNAKVRERCCHLRAHATKDGSIQLGRPRCPEKYTLQCCAGLRSTMTRYGRFNGNATKTTIGGAPFGLSLGNIVECVQNLITNLLQLRLTLRPKDGGQSGCCQLPLLRVVC